MDLYEVIRELREELGKVDLAIESLQEMIRTGTLTLGRRGRKSMVEEERRMVSGRVKKHPMSRRKKPRS